MLVLSRKVGESILVGKDITIKIDRVERGRVYLAIEAPQEVRILREEILHRQTGGKDASNGK